MLATLICTAAVFGVSMGPENGWLSATTIGPGLVAMTAFVAFLVVERTAENPIVPFSLFSDRNRLATFAAMFLVRGIGFTMTVLLAMYVQNIMGYSPLRAAISFIPFAIAMAIGTAASSRLVTSVLAAGGGDRRRHPGAGRGALRLDAQRAASRTSRTWCCPSSSAPSASA